MTFFESSSRSRLLSVHNLFRKPVPTPHQVRGRLFRDHALEPVDRAEEVPLSERYAAMTQDVVCRRYKEEEIRQGELLQIVVAFHFPVVTAGSPGDNLVLRAIHLCASQGLHEA